jgi:hypothetical protein
MSTQDTNAPAQPVVPAAGDNPPAAPAVSAPATDVTPPAPAPVVDETVTVKKSDWDRHLSRQSFLDKKEATLTKREQALARGEVFSFKQPVAPTQNDAQPPAGGQEEFSVVQDRKAERGLIALALQPEYRDVLDADPTFRDMLTKAPLSVLPLYAPDSVDAEDAVQQITELLNDRKAKLAPAPAAPAPEPVPAAPVTVQPGAPSPGIAEEGLQDQQYTDAIAPGTVKGIAEGLKHRFSKTARR